MRGDNGLTVWCVLGEERAQDAALRRVPDRGVVERVDESGDAQHVREEDELLADGRAHFARAGEKVDGAHPFVCGDAAARNMNRTSEGGWCAPLWSVSKGKATKDALCLGDKLMKLADEILEYELYATAHACVHMRDGNGRKSTI